LRRKQINKKIGAISSETERLDNYFIRESDPFQKYLFSGACYVRVGQCYPSVQRLLEENKDVRNNAELIDKLVAVCTEFLRFHPAFVFVQCLQSGKSVNGDKWTEIRELSENIGNIGRRSVEMLLHDLAQRESNEMDVNLFFTRWAKSCDTVYSDWVHSENFSKIVGDAVNTILRATSNPGSRS